MSQPTYLYRIPTNGWRSVVSSVVALGVLSLVIFALSSNPGETGLWFAFIFVLCMFLLFFTYTVVGFLYPDATELIVDRSSISWRTPWPNKRNARFYFSEIVELRVWIAGSGSEENDKISFWKTDGNLVKIPPCCFGGSATSVLNAIRENALIPIVIDKKRF